MPISAYDVAKTIGPIDIQGAKITIQFINNWSDKAIEEARNLRKSGQIDAVAWSGTQYIFKFCGKDVVHFGAAMYFNLETTIDGSTKYVFLMVRQAPTEYLKQPIQLLPNITLIDLVGDLQFAGVINGMWFSSPASYNDTSGWADNVITALTQKGILAATSGNDVEKRLFRPNSTAKRLDAVSWFTLAFPKPTDKTVAKEWQGDKNASDVYRPDLGYSAYLLDRNESIQGDINGATPIALFGLIDAALKSNVLMPYTDGSLGLDDEVNRADLSYMIAKTINWSDQPDVALPFWDLKDPKWNSNLGSIGACVSKGILKGYPDGSFFPEGTMTRAEVAVSIYKLLGLGSAPENPNTVTPTHTTLIQSFQLGSPTMTVNGKPVAMDVTPTVVEDRTLLPARYVVEPLGAQVTWSSTDQKVTITSTRPWIRLDKTISTTTATTVELWIGNPTAKVNGVEVPIDPANPKVAPLILPPGRTMVPLRFLGEALGAQVFWNPDTREIVIVSGPPPEPLKEKTLPPP